MSAEDVGVASMRERPETYVGSVRDGAGLLQLLWETVANSLDEHVAGHATTVRLTLEQGDWFVVDDDGRGIDPAVASAALTELRDRRDGGERPSQVRPTGAQGLGLVVVNALSEWLVLETHRDGRTLRTRAVRGQIVEPFYDAGPSERRGTRIAFKPDASIFTATRVDLRAVQERLEELGAFFPRVTFELAVAPRAMRLTRGLTDLATLGIDPWYLLHEPVTRSVQHGSTTIELAFAFLRGGIGRMRAYCNGVPNPEGGTHVTGFLRALREIAPSETPPLRTHVTAVVHALCPDPQYAGPTRSKLLNAELQSLFEQETRAALRELKAQHPDLAEKVREAMLSRL